MNEEITLRRINVNNPKNNTECYQLPKILFEDSTLSKLSLEAKVLYAILLERVENEYWVDVNGNKYVTCPIEEIQSLFNCGHNKAIKTLKELDSKTGIGLIDKEIQGLGLPNKLYVKRIGGRKINGR